MQVEEKLNEFMGLIKWASRKYSQQIPEREFSFDDFIGEGQLVFAKCLKEWEKKIKLVSKSAVGMHGLVPKCEKNIKAVLKSQSAKEKEFGKFFKTSLFNHYNGICSHRYLYAQKRQHTSVSIDDDFVMPLNDYERRNFSGFDDVFYKELIDHVNSRLDNEIEKKIFRLLADPPEGFCKLAIYRNRRKMKASHISKKTRSGVNVVKPTTGLILEYLRDSGYSISKKVYYLHLGNIKKTVKEVLQ